MTKRLSAAEIAAAEQRGAVKALREAAESWEEEADLMAHAPGKYYPSYWLKDRADQHQGGHDDQ